jgi:hypothetical protein
VVPANSAIGSILTVANTDTSAFLAPERQRAEAPREMALSVSIEAAPATHLAVVEPPASLPAAVSPAGHVTVRKRGRRFSKSSARSFTRGRCRFSPTGRLGHTSAQGAQKPVKGFHALTAIDEHGERSDGTHRPLSGALCPICGKVFVRFTSNRLYCSRVCQNRFGEHAEAAAAGNAFRAARPSTGLLSLQHRIARARERCRGFLAAPALPAPSQ